MKIMFNFKNFETAPEGLVFQVKTILSLQQAITCSKLTIETLEQGGKYVQS